MGRWWASFLSHECLLDGRDAPPGQFLLWRGDWSLQDGETSGWARRKPLTPRRGISSILWWFSPRHVACSLACPGLLGEPGLFCSVPGCCHCSYPLGWLCWKGWIVLLQSVCGTCSWHSVFSRLTKACHLFNNLNTVMKCHLGLLTSLHSFFSEVLDSQFSEHGCLIFSRDNVTSVGNWG